MKAPVDTNTNAESDADLSTSESMSTAAAESSSSTWFETDLPRVSCLRVLHICRERWTYMSGHTLARDVVVLEKINNE